MRAHRLSGAAVAVRLRPRHGRAAALAGAAAQFILLTLTLFLTAELWLWPLQDDPQWPVAHRLWLILLPLPVVFLTLANRDPMAIWRNRRKAHGYAILRWVSPPRPLCSQQTSSLSRVRRRRRGQ